MPALLNMSGLRIWKVCDNARATKGAEFVSPTQTMS